MAQVTPHEAAPRADPHRKAKKILNLYAIPSEAQGTNLTKCTSETMDPTLAPGYVSPNKGQEKAAKGHHWAEVQKTRTRTTANPDNGDTSSTASTPTTETTVPPYLEYTSKQLHLGLTSWRTGRSTLSDGEGIGGPADLEEVPVGVKRQALRLEDYAFPTHRLRTVMDGNSTHYSLGLTR